MGGEGKIVPVASAFNDLFEKMASMPLLRVKTKPKHVQRRSSMFGGFMSAVAPVQAGTEHDEENVTEMMSSDYNKYKYDPYALPSSSSTPSQNNAVSVRVIKSTQKKLKPLDFAPKLPKIDDIDGKGEDDEENHDEILKSGEKAAQPKTQKRKERAEYIKERKMSLASTDDGDERNVEKVQNMESGISEEIPSTDDDDDLRTSKKKKETLKNALKKKKKVKKNSFSKIDENDEGSDEDGQRKKKPNTTDRRQRKKNKSAESGGGHKGRPHTVSTVSMANPNIMDLEQKFAQFGFGSDNDGDDESVKPPEWHNSINWGHSSPLGNELYGNSFDDNNRPSVSRANMWGSMDGVEIGEFAMSLSLEDGFPAFTPSLQADINDKLGEKEQRAATAFAAFSNGGGVGHESSSAKSKGGIRPFTSSNSSAELVRGGGGGLKSTDDNRPNTAAKFPSWHYD